MQSVTPLQLKQRIDDGAVPELLDVREPWEFATCRIEGSINIPMSAIVNAHDKLDRHTEKVVICHHGIRSQQVVKYLERIGFAAVLNLEGGIDLWAETVAADMPRY
ncbi:MAG: rhodanese-like protein [Gammaproteobacteria bacterium]|nr:rhodanese-like protein [Gammaproteobacteria bacterium]